MMLVGGIKGVLVLKCEGISCLDVEIDDDLLDQYYEGSMRLDADEAVHLGWFMAIPSVLERCGSWGCSSES